MSAPSFSTSTARGDESFEGVASTPVATIRFLLLFFLPVPTATLSMSALITAHPGLKPLEEVDSEMAELIEQEKRRQVRVPLLFF